MYLHFHAFHFDAPRLRGFIKCRLEKEHKIVAIVVWLSDIVMRTKYAASGVQVVIVQNTPPPQKTILTTLRLLRVDSF